MPRPVTKGTIPILDFNSSGLAFSKWSGLKNSLYKMIGFDPHSQPGVINVEQKLTAETTGDQPEEFCRVAVNSSNGAQYWFSYTSGKIWERPTTGTWRLVHTTTPAAGSAGCLGAAEAGGYIYWATQSRLHRILVSDASTNDWATDAVEDWATFSVTDSAFHPMFFHPTQLILYIGDGNYVAQVDAGVFTANALDLTSPYRVKCLGQISNDLLIGTYVSDNISKTSIYRWNCWGVSFTSTDPIPEVGINAFLPADNMVLVQAGKAGNIYYYDGETLQLYSKIPGTYSSTAYGEVYPDSVANKEGQILFGFSNGSGNPTDELIYRIAKYDRNFNYIMDQPYPVSERSGSDFVLTGIEIGAILAVGSIVYTSWKRSVTVTMTIASPGVVTYTAHNFTNGDAISFSTTGALPTGITAGTLYYVRSVDANSFHLYDTAAHAISGGATGRVNTSGTQSGVHTAVSSKVDKLDTSTKLDGAYFETRVMIVNRKEQANFFEAYINYASKPTNTDINFYLDNNYVGYGSALDKVDDDDANVVITKNEGTEFNTLQMKIKITASANTAPQIESGAVVTR